MVPGYFDDINTVPVSEGGVYLLQGSYLLEVQRVLLKDNRNGAKRFIVETKILESSNGERPAGIQASWIQKLDQDAAKPNIKRFIMAATGCKADEVTGPAVDSIVGVGNPLRGTKVRVQCEQVTTSKGAPFTKHRWMAVDGSIADAA